MLDAAAVAKISDDAEYWRAIGSPLRLTLFAFTTRESALFRDNIDGALTIEIPGWIARRMVPA